MYLRDTQMVFTEERSSSTWNRFQTRLWKSAGKSRSCLHTRPTVFQFPATTRIYTNAAGNRAHPGTWHTKHTHTHREQSSVIRETEEYISGLLDYKVAGQHGALRFIREAQAACLPWQLEPWRDVGWEAADAGKGYLQRGTYRCVWGHQLCINEYVNIVMFSSDKM